MATLLYLNDRLVESSRAHLSPFDHGFLYGFGLFETMRSYNGRIFRLEDHLQRLKASAQQLGIPEPGLDLVHACYQTLKANNLMEARLRLTLTAGPGDPIPDTSTCLRPTVLITAQPIIGPAKEKYECGYQTILSSIRRNSQSPLSRIKSTSYIENVLARRESRLRKADEAVILNEKGMVTETSTSNIFIVSKGVLVTPHLESGALGGITRATVLEIAPTVGLKCEEREVTVPELTGADEVFVTSSIIEIMPVTSFEGRPVGRGKPGEITASLLKRYRDLVRLETGSARDSRAKDPLPSGQVAGDPASSRWVSANNP